MSSALIGHTGFVGSTLLCDGAFDALFNSSNIGEIRGKSFDRIVCAGVTAVKWWANRNPDEDLSRIRGLMDCLTEVRCERFVLISTIDVYPSPVGMTEADETDVPGLHAYGSNRLVLERFIRDRFACHHIVRLPALFGPGLKKNVIFDMMTGNQLDVINPDSRFQWYPVPRLSRDLAVIEAKGVNLVNIVTEPVSTGAIHDRFFPGLDIGRQAAPTALYDNRTIHPNLFGGPGPYHMGASEVMDALAGFLENAQC